MKKRIVCFVLGLVMMLSSTMTVFAKTEAQLKQEKSQAENQLSNTNDKIDSVITFTIPAFFIRSMEFCCFISCSNHIPSSAFAEKERSTAISAVKYILLFIFYVFLIILL